MSFSPVLVFHMSAGTVGLLSGTAAAHLCLRAPVFVRADRRLQDRPFFAKRRYALIHACIEGPCLTAPPSIYMK
jgi:hypothetical protein